MGSNARTTAHLKRVDAADHEEEADAKGPDIRGCRVERLTHLICAACKQLRTHVVLRELIRTYLIERLTKF